MTATARPWDYRKSKNQHDGAFDFAINSSEAFVLAEAFGRSADGSFLDAESNAALIVKAVNNFDALVSCVNKMEVFFRTMMDAMDIDFESTGLNISITKPSGEKDLIKYESIDAILSEARTILSQVKGEQHDQS